MKLIDLSGKIFGRLSVIGMSKKIGKNGEIYWRCVCTCGNQKSIGASNMKNGKTQSCGCLRKELASQRAKELFTKPKTKCSVGDCLSDTSKGGHGICGKHAQRMRRYGDVNYVTPEDKRSRSSIESQIKNITEVKKTTYRKFMGKHQHRVIAEKMLGRQLTEVEHVHHKDGNKHNNDESNLQVMTASEHQKLHAKERMAKNATPYYQTRALEMLYKWFEKNSDGHPVLNMPGGSGKSVVIASLAKDALQNWPETRILMLVHSKELIIQNADKLRKLWPNAPLGIYSASVGKREIGEPITYAGIGSVAKRSKQIGHIDVCLIDEVHSVSNTESGIYRKLISELLEINPSMRIVGFSASPYRLGQGLITEGKEAIFSEILEPVSIEELVFKGHLVPLRSKVTSHKLETDGLHKRQGEYIAAEMEARFNTYDNNTSVVQEIIKYASNRKHWLIFCSGVAHSEAVSECMRSFGISSESLDATHSKAERERKISEFESGKIRALCNVGILTTGYDFPSLDCISFLRATASPGLYLQCAVRGMRPCDGKSDCLVLDFAGVVEQHGPITNVKPPPKKGDKVGEAPVKVCENCQEICHASVKVCPACETPFPAPETPPMRLSNLDIMGESGIEMEVSQWTWRKHISRTSGKEMISCTLYGGISEIPVTSYYAITHDGWAGQKARKNLASIAYQSGVMLNYASADLCDIANQMSNGTPPKIIEYRKDGKYHTVLRLEW